MSGMRRGITIAAFLAVTLVPVAAAISWVAVVASPVEASVAEPVMIELESRGRTGAAQGLPEPAMLVLVGSGLLGLAFIINTTTRT